MVVNVERVQDLNPTRDAFCSYPSNRPYRSQIHQETQPETGHDPVLPAEPLKGPIIGDAGPSLVLTNHKADAVVKRRPGLDTPSANLLFRRRFHDLDAEARAVFRCEFVHLIEHRRNDH